jgi:hypothetical protein
MKRADAFVTRVALVSAWVLLCFIGVGQSQEVTRTQLRLAEVAPVSGIAGAPTLPIRCDGSGNIYVRSDYPSPFQAPVYKVNGKGEKKATFSLEGVNGWEDSQFYDFAVGPGGEVYLLAARMAKGRKIENSVLSFSDDGNFRFATAIDIPSFSIDQIAVYSTGEFLVMGWKRSDVATKASSSDSSADAAKQDFVEPMILVLDRSGHLVREVTLADAPALSKDKSVPPMQLARPAISLARTAAGDDGSIYILLRTEKATIFSVPPRANVVRRLEVQPPGEEYGALDIRYSSGMGLVILFARKVGTGRWDTANAVFSIVDPERGERLYDYQSTPEVGGAFACYAHGTFLFWNAKDGKPVIRQVVPR